eukprot:259470_1
MAFVKDLTSSVMTGVTSLGSKAFDAFGINQATLSGAIDIVVIKHPPNSRPRCLDEDYKSHITSHVKFPLEDFNDDIDSTKPYYMSSPFHVRFGKLQLLRSNEVNVSITINDKHIDNLQMKLGIEGEAYFVVPTNKPLKHKKLLTSPLIKPHTSIKNITPFKISPINIQPLQPINSGPINDTKIKQKIKQINLSQIMSGKSSKNDDMPPLMLNIGSPNSADSGDVSHDISIKINSIPDEKDSKDDSEHLSTNSMHLDSVSVSIDKPINTVMKSMNSNENIHISPTLSATSSMLEDREVLSKDLMMDSATNTDNESVCTGGTGTDNESNIESDVGFDNFSGTHVMIEHIKMSLCASKLIIDSEKKNKKMFQQYQITYNQFCSDPSILFDKNLIIQYKQRLYPAKIAMPMLFSLLSFGRPLTDKAIKKLNKKEEKEEKQNKIEDASEDVEGTNDYAWYWSWFKKKRKKKKRKRYKWKCSKITRSDHEQKICIRRRKSMIRRLGRRRARNRWLSMLRGWMKRGRKKGYNGFKGLGTGFRRGYVAGKQSVRLRRRAVQPNGFAGGVRGIRIPKVRLRKMRMGSVPLPPRIQLLDLQTSGRGFRRGRRGLISDIEQDIDVYDYGDMENEKKCMLYEGDNVYEICFGYDFVEIKKFIGRKERVLKGDYGLMRDLSMVDMVGYVGYEYEKYKSMMNGDIGGVNGKMLLGGGDYRDTYYVDLYEFVYVDVDGDKEQCFMEFDIFDVCLGVGERSDMIVRVEGGYDEREYRFNFSDDSDWNEVDEIIGNDGGKSTQKCVRLLEVKMCMIYENGLKFKILLYKNA